MWFYSLSGDGCNCERHVSAKTRDLARMDPPVDQSLISLPLPQKILGETDGDITCHPKFQPVQVPSKHYWSV